MRALRDNDGRWDGMHVTTIGCPTHPRSEEEAEERNAWTNVLDYRKCHWTTVSLEAWEDGLRNMNKYNMEKKVAVISKSQYE